jgi:hypothetical protein
MRKPTPSDAGEAGELLVAADLLTRGLEVTKPFNRNGPDDLHVRTRKGWLNIQVRLGRVKKTGTLTPNTRGYKFTSEILAWVDLKGKRIRYMSNTGDPVPDELL